MTDFFIEIISLDILTEASNLIRTMKKDPKLSKWEK